MKVSDFLGSQRTRKVGYAYFRGSKYKLTLYTNKHNDWYDLRMVKTKPIPDRISNLMSPRLKGNEDMNEVLHSLSISLGHLDKHNLPFYRKNFNAKHRIEVTAKTQRKGRQKPIKRTSLSKSQAILLVTLKANPTIPTGKIKDLLKDHLSPRTIGTNLNKLKKMGYVDFTKKGRKRIWKITSSGRKVTPSLSSPKIYDRDHIRALKLLAKGHSSAKYPGELSVTEIREIWGRDTMKKSIAYFVYGLEPKMNWLESLGLVKSKVRGKTDYKVLRTYYSLTNLGKKISRSL